MCRGPMLKILLSLLFIVNATLSVQAAATTTAAEIVERMMAHNQQQARMLIEFRTQRKFFAANTRFKMDSTMVVQTVFRHPDSMESSVISTAGSDFIKGRVFDEILKAEGETHKKEDKEQVDITPKNYDFAFTGEATCDSRQCYRLAISPKRKDKYSL